LFAGACTPIRSVAILYGMETSHQGWNHLDYADYGDEELSDDEFATRFRERDHTKVVSREMIETQRQGTG
jgi:hypothetical protein